MSSDVLFTPMTDTTDCRINGERLWNSLMTLAEIGATPKGGCCRLTLTDLDRQGRDLVIRWAQAAGMRVTVPSKRPYRKGKPLSAAERQQKAVARKKTTHKEVRVFVRDSLKNQLQIMCESEGITQAEMIERLIEMESAKLGIDVTTSHS